MENENIVSHFEIPATDLKQAQKFYSSVFDWKFKPWDENYVLITATKSDEDTGMPLDPGSINGGLQKRGPRALNPMIVITVEDIDIILKKIESHGGRAVVSKEMIGEMGMYAQFEDPDGNRLGLFQVEM